mgnify:CR=1 FL=1
MGDFNDFTDVGMFPTTVGDAQLPPGKLREKHSGLDKSLMGLEMRGGGGGGTQVHHHENPYNDAWIRDWTSDAEGREDDYIRRLGFLETTAHNYGGELRHGAWERALLQTQQDALGASLRAQGSDFSGQLGGLSGQLGGLSGQVQNLETRFDDQSAAFNFGLQGLDAATAGLDAATAGIDLRLSGQADQFNEQLRQAQQGWSDQLAAQQAGWDTQRAAWNQQAADWTQQYSQQQRAIEAQLVTEREEYQNQLESLRNVYGIQNEQQRTEWEQQSAQQRDEFAAQLQQYNLMGGAERAQLASQLEQFEQIGAAERENFASQLENYEMLSADERRALEQQIGDVGQLAAEERAQLAEQLEQYHTTSTERAEEWRQRFAQSQEQQRIADAIQRRDLEASLAEFGNQYQRDWATGSAALQADYTRLIEQASSESERARLQQAMDFERLQRDQYAAYNQRDQELAAQDRVFGTQLDDLRRQLGIERDLYGQAQMDFEQQQELYNRTERERLQQSLGGFELQQTEFQQQQAALRAAEQQKLQQSLGGFQQQLDADLSGIRGDLDKFTGRQLPEGWTSGGDAGMGIGATVMSYWQNPTTGEVYQSGNAAERPPEGSGWQQIQSPRFTGKETPEEQKAIMNEHARVMSDFNTKWEQQRSRYDSPLDQKIGAVKSDLTSKVGELEMGIGDFERRQFEQLTQSQQEAAAARGQLESQLTGQIGDVQTGLTGRIGQVETSFTDKLGDVKSSVSAAQQQSAAARSQLESELASQIGQVETGLAGQIGDVQAGLSEAQLQSAAARGQLESQLTGQLTQSQLEQEAARKQLEFELSGQLGDVKSDLTGKVGELEMGIGDFERRQFEQLTGLESDLTGQIGDVKTGLTAELGDVRTGLTADLTKAQQESAAARSQLETGLTGQIGDVRTGLTTDLNRAQQESAAARSQLESGLTGQIGDVKTGLTADLTKAQQESAAARSQLESGLTGQIGQVRQDVTGQLGDFRADIQNYKDTLAYQNEAQQEYYAANKRFREMQIQDAERARTAQAYGSPGRPMNQQVKGVRRAGSSRPGGLVRSKTPRNVFNRSGLRISSLNI